MDITRKWPVLTDRTLTFKMMWEAEQCDLRFIKSWMRLRGELPPSVVQATKIGKTFELIRAAKTRKERQAAVRGLIRRVEPTEVRTVMTKLRVYLERAATIDAKNKDLTGERVSVKSPQYYANVSQNDRRKPKWRLAAKPDEVQTLRTKLGYKIIVIDEKTSGKMSRRLRDNFYFFGLVVSLAESEEAQAELAKAMELHHTLCESERKRCQHKNRSGRGKRHGHFNYERPYFPPKPEMAPPPQIELKPILTGSILNEAGEEVAADQPEPFNYALFFEGQQLFRVRKAIDKIEGCFERDEFLPSKNYSCGGCPFWRGCSGYEEYQQEKELTSQAAALVQLQPATPVVVEKHDADVCADTLGPQDEAVLLEVQRATLLHICNEMLVEAGGRPIKRCSVCSSYHAQILPGEPPCSVGSSPVGERVECTIG